ncbi:alpha-L-fucosidase, partial [bacterium]|nr:alpha-L-fucosidase [bacterium]
MPEPPDRWKWFSESRFGLFIHWGPYAALGRGEQVLYREHLDQREYAEAACAWRPCSFDAERWADVARRAGVKYAVLTTRHHDGYCLWDSRHTDYTSAAQAAKRDFVKEFAEAFRAAGLRVGFYYSLGDWRIPGFWEGPGRNPEGWGIFRQYVHDQVRELLSNYGRVDVLWFDGAWPHTAEDWGAQEIIEMARGLQPEILINNRFGPSKEEPGMGEVNRSLKLGDFGTPEHEITADPNRLWESCQVSTWRLWGYTAGERWRGADVLLDTLCQSAHKGGNLLLNVGPDAEGHFPSKFVERALRIGRWLQSHGEAIYGTQGGDVTEFVTRGWQTVRDNCLYLIFRFWEGGRELRLADLMTSVCRATLLGSNQELEFAQEEGELILRGLPNQPPTDLFPVIRLECSGRPESNEWGKDRLWQGDPL